MIFSRKLWLISASVIEPSKNLISQKLLILFWSLWKNYNNLIYQLIWTRFCIVLAVELPSRKQKNSCPPMPSNSKDTHCPLKSKTSNGTFLRPLSLFSTPKEAQYSSASVPGATKLKVFSLREKKETTSNSVLSSWSKKYFRKLIWTIVKKYPWSYIGLSTICSSLSRDKLWG